MIKNKKLQVLKVKQDRPMWLKLISILFTILLLLIDPILFIPAMIIAIIMAVVLVSSKRIVPSIVKFLINSFSNHFYISIIIDGVIAILGMIYPMEILTILLSVLIYYQTLPNLIKFTKELFNNSLNHNDNVGNDTKNEYLEVGLTISIGLLALVILSIILHMILFI